VGPARRPGMNGLGAARRPSGRARRRNGQQDRASFDGRQSRTITGLGAEGLLAGPPGVWLGGRGAMARIRSGVWAVNRGLEFLPNGARGQALWRIRHRCSKQVHRWAYRRIFIQPAVLLSHGG